METNTTFKSYSEKSKARRALVQVYGVSKEAADNYLVNVNGKPGFYIDTDSDSHVVPMLPEDAPAATPIAALPTEQPAGSEVLEALGAPAELVQEMAEVEAEQQDETPALSALSAFGDFALSQLTAPSNATTEAVRVQQRATGLKIERNREERNGVKMPSAGGMCRAVWDALNNLMTHDEATGLANVPSVSDIKTLAESKGWNVNNASIEYYQWRKFNGITGRGKKQV